MNYYQYYYFSEEEIEKANINVIKIKEKILELYDKLEHVNDIKKIKLNETIERLNMSKECIKHYYGLTINL